MENKELQELKIMMKKMKEEISAIHGLLVAIHTGDVNFKIDMTTGELKAKGWRIW